MQGYKQITCTSGDSPVIQVTTYTDDKCTAAKPNTDAEEIITIGVCKPDVLGGGKNYKCNRTNGKYPAAVEAKCTSPVLGQCTLYDDAQCATKAQVNGKDQTTGDMASLALALDGVINPAENTCHTLTLGDGNKGDVLAQCPKNDKELIEWTQFGSSDATCGGGDMNTGEGTYVVKDGVCVTIPVGNPLKQDSTATNVICTGPTTTCDKFSFQSCQAFTDAACKTAYKPNGADQTTADMTKFGTAVDTKLKEIQDKCVPKAFGGKNAIFTTCDGDKSITWQVYPDQDLCTGTPNPTVTAKPKECFPFAFSGIDTVQSFICGESGPTPGPAVPGPIEPNTTGKNLSADGAIQVGLTMAVATVSVAATLI